MYKTLRAQTLHYFARPHDGLPAGPVSTPAAWRGRNLREQSAWSITLSAGEVSEIKNAVTLAESSGKAMESLGKKDFPLPTLSARIDDWRREIRYGRGFVLIRGFPVDEWSASQAALAYWCFGHHLGIPGAQNPQGDLLGHVRDQRTGEDVRLYRTNRNIDVHCDAADVVGLLCLQPAKQGGLSRIVSSVSVFNEVLRQRPDLAPRLFRPVYFDTKGEGGLRALPIAPCRYADGELRTFWQSDYYRSAQALDFVPKFSGDEQTLLDLYDGIAGDPEYYLDMDLRPGDMQLLSNHTILHARTGYEDWPEPERRRHLLRLWISLPEKRSLRQRWLTGRSYAGLMATSSREILRTQLASRGQAT